VSEYVGGAGSAGLRIVARDLAKIPAELRRAARTRIKVAGESVLRQGQANASWSSRIPAAMSLQVSFSGRNPGVTIVVDSAKAPHARPFEGIVADTWRHPVFERSGRPTPWVQQAARPYLLPAAQAGFDLAVEGITAAVDEVLTNAGFR
jgi:hypothetical protein